MATKKILLVDDDVLLTDGLKALFAEHSWEVEVLNESKEIEKTIASFNPDIILLDIFMQDKNGLDFLKEMETTHPDWNKRVIMLTSMDGEVYLAKALEYGVTTYLHKDDANEEKILATVENKYKELQD